MEDPHEKALGHELPTEGPRTVYRLDEEPGEKQAAIHRNPSSNSPLALLGLVKQHDAYHPIHWPTWKKWAIITAYCLVEVFVTITSTSYVAAESLITEKFGGSAQVVTLGQSMFIVGNAVGPAVLGPLSDFGGRKWVYVGSIALYAILNIGTALAMNLPMLIIFQFLCGAAGSTALSNVAGTIADLYGDRDNAGQAMALFVLSSSVGPSLGGPVGEWIVSNPKMGLPWIFWINVIVGGVFAAAMCLIPETLPRIVIARNARRIDTTDPEEIALMDMKVNVFKEIRFVTTMALRIMVTEPIVIFLALYNGWAYGLVFLYLDGVYSVFVVNNHLSYIAADLTYLNFVGGVIVMFCFMPLQTYLYKRDRLKRGGQNRPEARFLTSLVAVWLFPVSLFWFAFTSDGKHSYWNCIVAGGMLGFCDPLLYLGMLNYITDAYPNIAASAVAAFLIPSFTIAAAFAHIGLVMFERMSTTWAMATLAFVSLGIVVLVNVVYFYGPKLRARSKLARSF